MEVKSPFFFLEITSVFIEYPCNPSSGVLSEVTLLPVTLTLSVALLYMLFAWGLGFFPPSVSLFFFFFNKNHFVYMILHWYFNTGREGGWDGESLFPPGSQTQERVLVLVPVTRHRARAPLSPKDRVSPSLFPPSSPAEVFQTR